MNASSCTALNEAVTTEMRRTAYDLHVMTSAEFMAADCTVDWLIKDVLCIGQPFIIGGASKTLKTSIALDLAISLSCQENFLGHWPVDRPAKTLFFSGESGASKLKATFKCICEAKKVDPSSQHVAMCFDLPRLTDPKCRQAILTEVGQHEADLVIVDPAYLALMDRESAGQAGNVFSMGVQLRDIAQDVQGAGVTLGLIHHVSKSAARANMLTRDAPNLEDLSQAGFAEFAGQWLLIGRRCPYEEGTGTHLLWMRHGGRNADGGMSGVDIREGTRQTGKRWSVTVRSPADITEERAANKEQREARKQADLIERHKSRVLEVMARPELADGETESRIGSLAGLNTANRNRAVSELAANGDIVVCDVWKNRQRYDGYKLAHAESDTPTQSDRHGLSD